MITFELGVGDLADTRFALSPLHETVLSVRVLREPGLYALHLPWRRSVLGQLGGLDTALLMALEGQNRALPDFLTPRPPAFPQLSKKNWRRCAGHQPVWCGATWWRHTRPPASLNR